MKTTENKERFIELRAEGWSYAKIAKELSISKSTCSEWEKDLAEQIRKAKGERLEDLYTLYRIGREEHIKKLGEILGRIDEALAQKDLTEIPADKLLRLKLEYEKQIQAQHIETAGDTVFEDFTDREMKDAVRDLYERVRAGSLTSQQAKTELDTLEGIRKSVSTDPLPLFSF